MKGDNEESALAEVSSLLQEDKNYSLAKMAIKENKKRKVKKMTNIYITAKVSYYFSRQKKKHSNLVKRYCRTCRDEYRGHHASVE